MLKQGQRVEQLTKKVGQVPRTGVVQRVEGEKLVIRWDDGHESVVFGARGLLPASKE